MIIVDRCVTGAM